MPKDLTYTLEISEEADFNFSNPVFTADGIEDLTPLTTGDVEYILPIELRFGVYKWHVAAFDELENSGGFSDPFEFTIREIELPPPRQLRLDPDLEFIKDTTPKFTWEPPETADLPSLVSYQLQVVQRGRPFQDPFFDSGLNVTVIPPATEYQTKLNEALSDSRYQWRVIARDAKSEATSDEAAFTVDTILPLKPEELQEIIINPNADVRLFSWKRSVDPDPPGRPGDQSGVEKYNVVVTQKLTGLVVEDKPVSDSTCTFENNTNCRFITERWHRATTPST